MTEVGQGNKLLGIGNSAPREIGGSARKMMERANAGLGQPIAPGLFTTQPERDIHDRTPDRNVRSLEDVTRGLGLDRVDEQRIQAAVGGTRVAYDKKTHNRLFLAVQKIVEMMRRSFKHVPAETRREISLRARAYWRNNNATDYTKPAEARYRARGAAMGKSESIVLMPDGRMLLVKAMPASALQQTQGGGAKPMGSGEKPPPGFIAIPRSKKGGYKSPDGKQYWYPDGKGVRGHAEEEQPGSEGAAKPGAVTGAQGAKGPPPLPSKGPQQPQGAQQPPGKGAPMGKPGASAGGGEGGGDGHPEPKFAPAPDGAHRDEQINHHVQERQKHLAAKKKFAKKDPQRAAKHHEAANQHTRAANPLLKQKFAEERGGAKAGAPAGGGAPPMGGDDEETPSGPQTAPGGLQPPQEGADDEGAGAAPPEGDEGFGAAPGAPAGPHPFEQETQEGLSRSPSGVRADEKGNRMTAAKPRDRAVPESETVRKTREALGRSLNVMADLSSAHDHLGSLKQKLAMIKKGRDPETGQPIDPRLARRHVSMIQAEMAATKHDIVQLEDAHDQSMRELKQMQQSMMAERIQSHPIFQAFIQLMEKLGSFGDKLAGMVDPESEAKTNEAKIAAKQGEGGPDYAGLALNAPQASEADLADEGPTDVLGINKDEIDRMFGNADDSVKQQAQQAFETLQRLAEKHGDVDGPASGGGEPSQFGADDPEDDDASSLISQLGQMGDGDEDEGEKGPNLDAKAAKEKQLRGSIEDDDGSFDADIARAKGKKETAEKRASAQGSMFEERTKGMSESQRMKFALGAGDEDTDTQAPTKPGADAKTQASGVRPKKRTPNEGGDDKGTVATGGKKKRKVPGELVKSEAWGIALSIGMQASAELRDLQAIHAPRFIVKSKPQRHVPFFFNEL